MSEQELEEEIQEELQEEQEFVISVTGLNEAHTKMMGEKRYFKSSDIYTAIDEVMEWIMSYDINPDDLQTIQLSRKVVLLPKDWEEKQGEEVYVKKCSLCGAFFKTDIATRQYCGAACAEEAKRQRGRLHYMQVSLNMQMKNKSNKKLSTRLPGSVYKEFIKNNKTGRVSHEFY